MAISHASNYRIFFLNMKNTLLTMFLYTNVCLCVRPCIINLPSFVILQFFHENLVISAKDSNYTLN